MMDVDIESCLSFEEESKKCVSCNTYFRLENGICLFIYSFEAVYYIRKKNYKSDGTKLFNVEYLDNYIINKIQVDDKFVKTNTNYYKFDTDGEHKVRINIDLKNSSSLNKFFENINELVSINFTNNFNTKGVENMDEMFSSTKNLVCLNMSYLNTENVRTMKNMFNSCMKLSEIDLSNINTKKVESISGLFSGCKSLTNVDISSFELENNKDISNLFSQCNLLNSINFGKINTKNVLNMSNLFNDCNSLEAIDLNYFSTENVEDMSNMFKNCEKLKEIDVSKFKTDKVKNMFGLFENSGVINLDLIKQ